MSFLSKLKDIVSLNDQDDCYYECEDIGQYARGYGGHISSAETSTPQPIFNPDAVKPSNNMSGVGHFTSSVVMIEPRAFEEMFQVIDTLRQQKSVILNMALVREEEAQHAVDFLTGGTYAIDGHYERIGDKIFLFTPSCVRVSIPNNSLNEIVQAPASHSITPKVSWANEAIAQ
jgi:cell division inhibitor SepF